jgi:hypothetical protein
MLKHKETKMLSKSATEKNIHSYKWYEYAGNKHSVQFKGTKRNIMPGDVIGIRYGTRSHSSKAFVAFADNPKTDFSITDRVADNLIKKSREVELEDEPIDLLKKSKNKRVSSQHDNDFFPSSAWDAKLYKPKGRLPSPNLNGYKAKDFQWRAVSIPKLTVSKTRSKKHTFQKGEWIGLRYDSASRGGVVVDNRGIIFKVSSDTYSDIADNSVLLEKNKWPDFHFTPEHIKRLSEERHKDKIRQGADKRKKVTEERNAKNQAENKKRIERKREKLRLESELALKRGDFKKSERTMKAREDLGLNRTPNEAFDAFLRGNILDEIDNEIDYDLGDEYSDIGAPIKEKFESDEDEETGSDISAEDEGEDSASEEDPEFEQNDAEEDLSSRETDTGLDLMDALDDEIDKTREALEDSVGSDEDLDTEDEEDEADEEEDEADADETDDADDDFDSEDDDAEDDDAEDDDAEDDDAEDDDADDDDAEDDAEESEEAEETDDGNEEAEETDDAEESESTEEDSEEDGDEDSGGDDAGSKNKKDKDGKDGKSDSDKNEESKKDVEVGDILTFKADESEQRQFLVFEIVPGKNNPDVQNYLMFDINGGSNKYNIFRSSKHAKTKIEQHTNVLRRATGSELRKVYKKASDLVLDREAIIS